jgi:hypothetical protein
MIHLEIALSGVQEPVETIIGSVESVIAARDLSKAEID